MILGSRFQVPGQALENGMSRLRYTANRFLSFFDRLVLQLPLTEFHTGFRIYTNPVLSAKVVVADGSGLSRQNRIAPATMTAWLNTFADDDRLGAIFINSLAVPGEKGTLRKRFREENLEEGTLVQAKSGYIDGVSCLSGYVTATDGRRRSFSIMVNRLTRSARPAKRLQEKIVAAIAKDLAPVEVQLGSD